MHTVKKGRKVRRKGERGGGRKADGKAKSKEGGFQV